MKVHYPELMEGTPDDWRRVWQAIDARRQAVPMSLTELYELSMSEGTYRKMAAEGVGVARKDNRIKICRALGWTDDSIERLLRGGAPVVDLPPATTDLVITRLDGISEKLDALQESHDRLAEMLAEAATIGAALDAGRRQRSARGGIPQTLPATDTRPR